MEQVDLLKADCNCFGTEDDNKFTDSEIELSWNNSCAFNLFNPLPVHNQNIYKIWR